MDGSRFDALARTVGTAATRRTALRALGGGAIAVAFGRRALEVEAAGCLQPGKACKHGGPCCSGVCRRHKCRNAPGQDTCTIKQDACTGGFVPCHDFRCSCFVTRSGASVCADGSKGFLCFACSSNADCAAGGFGDGSICVRADRGNCSVCAAQGGTACVPPCPAA